MKAKPQRSGWQRFGLFMGRILLIVLGVFAISGISCLFGTRCSSEQWSDRQFWLALINMLAAMPVVVAALSTGRGYFTSPFTAGPDSAIAVDIINRERRELSGRTTYLFTMLVSGAIGIGISALISILGS